MVLGYIGYGEAAFEMSTGLRNEGLIDIVAFDNMVDHQVFGPMIKKRAKMAGVKLLDSPQKIAEISDLIIVAVPANITLSACESVVQYLRAGQIYVDVSAASPATKKCVAKLVGEQSIDFVDVAMMGVLPTFKHKVPILASGTGALRFCKEMAPYGMDIEVVSEVAGAASGIKLIRSLCMKGLAALVMETLEASAEFGVEDVVIPGICKTLEECSFEQTIHRLCTGTALHAARRAAELSGSVEMLREVGLDSTMVEAAMKKHELIAGYNLKERFAGNAPKVWPLVIEAIKEIQSVSGIKKNAISVEGVVL